MMFDFGDEDSENFLFDQPLSVNNGIFLLNHVINETVMDRNFGYFGEVRTLCNVFFIVLDLRLTKDWLSGIDSLFLCLHFSFSVEVACSAERQSSIDQYLYPHRQHLRPYVGQRSTH